jgi:hypothetical protein
METVIVVVVLMAIPTGIFALHRFGLYLERRRLLHYWHSKPSGGAGYNPFQEMIQPQMRHVVQVDEQQLRAENEGGPPGLERERGEISPHGPRQ